jgi:hypothetical protein
MATATQERVRKPRKNTEPTKISAANIAAALGATEEELMEGAEPSSEGFNLADQPIQPRLPGEDFAETPAEKALREAAETYVYHRDARMAAGKLETDARNVLTGLMEFHKAKKAVAGKYVIEFVATEKIKVRISEEDDYVAAEREAKENSPTLFDRPAIDGTVHADNEETSEPSMTSDAAETDEAA